MPAATVLTSGEAERIGEPEAVLRYNRPGDDDGAPVEERRYIPDHRAGLSRIMMALQASGAIRELTELTAIGHRVVHGGERFRQPVAVDNEVIGRIRDMIPLAPLHSPANLLGIEVMMQVAPEATQVAVFDTAFHQTLPPRVALRPAPFPVRRTPGTPLWFSRHLTPLRGETGGCIPGHAARAHQPHHPAPG